MLFTFPLVGILTLGIRPWGVVCDYFSALLEDQILWACRAIKSAIRQLHLLRQYLLTRLIVRTQHRRFPSQARTIGECSLLFPFWFIGADPTPDGPVRLDQINIDIRITAIDAEAPTTNPASIFPHLPLPTAISRLH